MTFVILNFHGVGTIPAHVGAEERDWWLETEHFEAVLDLVRGHDRVRLTFDDGNASDAVVVLPILLKRRLSARFFVCSGRMDKADYLDQGQVCELLSWGMGVGSHGMAHVSWRGLDSSRLAEELGGSRRLLERITGVPIETAACPFGEYDSTVLAGLRCAGYRTVYTSDDGVAVEDSFLQARTTVTRSMPLPTVKRLVEHGPGLLERCRSVISTCFKRIR